MEGKVQKKGGISSEDFVIVENYMDDRDTIMEWCIDMPEDHPPHHQPPGSPPRRRIPSNYDIEANITPTKRSSHYRLFSAQRAVNLSDKTCFRAILLLILICFFLFWWFSSPVSLVVKDGRLMGAHTKENLSVSLIDTRVSLERLTSLAVAAKSPNPSLNSQ